MSKSKLPQFSVYSLKDSGGNTVITVSTKQLRDRMMQEHPLAVSFIEIKVNKNVEDWLDEDV